MMFKMLSLNAVLLTLFSATCVCSMDSYGAHEKDVSNIQLQPQALSVVQSPPSEERSLLSAHALSSPTTANENTDDDSVLPGVDDIHFATPCLEYYIGGSVVCWNGLNSVLEDMEILAQAASTGLAACTQFVGTDSTAKFVVYSIQLMMIGNLFHKFYTLSKKLTVIQEKRKLVLKQQNQLNLENDLDPRSALLINGVDAAHNKDVYATEALADYYSCCAVSRTILVDQVGVLSIFCQCMAGSILNYCQILDANERSGYLLMGTLFGVGATVLHAYTKVLIKKTKDWEVKAINAMSYVKYQKRIAARENMV